MKKYVMFISLTLLGCGNFTTNKTEVSYHDTFILDARDPALRPPPLPSLPPPVPPKIVVHPVYVKESSLTKDMCPRFEFPALPPTPELPIDALKRLNHTDQIGIDNLMMKHIDELRQYIATVKKIQQDAKERYLIKCVNFTKPSR
jgi:hypothetical protein